MPDPVSVVADLYAAALHPGSWSLTVEDVDLQVPRLELPLADPVMYLDEHGSKFGIHARNVMHIAPQACSHGPHPSSLSAPPDQLGCLTRCQTCFVTGL